MSSGYYRLCRSTNLSHPDLLQCLVLLRRTKMRCSWIMAERCLPFVMFNRLEEVKAGWSPYNTHTRSIVANVSNPLNARSAFENCKSPPLLDRKLRLERPSFFTDPYESINRVFKSARKIKRRHRQILDVQFVQFKKL